MDALLMHFSEQLETMLERALVSEAVGHLAPAVEPAGGADYWLVVWRVYD